jgi:hypothetical protein
MAFPGVCAIVAVGIKTADTVKAMAAKVENIVGGKRRMLAYLLQRSGACLSEVSQQN